MSQDVTDEVTRFWVYAQATSFVDNGLRAVVFGDGTAYIYGLCDPHANQPACINSRGNYKAFMVQAKLSKTELALLDSVFAHSQFSAQPAKIYNSDISDGNSLHLYRGTADGCHGVYKYPYHDVDFNSLRERNPAIVAIAEYMDALLRPKLETGRSISVTRFFKRIVARRCAMETRGALDSCSSWMFDTLARPFFAKNLNFEGMDELIIGRESR